MFRNRPWPWLALLVVGGCSRLARDVVDLGTPPEAPAPDRVYVAWATPPSHDVELARRFQSRLVELLQRDTRVSDVRVAPHAVAREDACAVAAGARADVVVLLSVVAPEPDAPLVCVENRTQRASSVAYLAYGLCQTVGLGVLTRGTYCDELVDDEATCARWARDRTQRAARGVAFAVARVERWCRIPDGWTLGADALDVDRAAAIAAARRRALARLDELPGLVNAGFFAPER
jgi:hypothetical protein